MLAEKGFLKNCKKKWHSIKYEYDVKEKIVK